MDLGKKKKHNKIKALAYDHRFTSQFYNLTVNMSKCDGTSPQAEITAVSFYP